MATVATPPLWVRPEAVAVPVAQLGSVRVRVLVAMVVRVAMAARVTQQRQAARVAMAARVASEP